MQRWNLGRPGVSLSAGLLWRRIADVAGASASTAAHTASGEAVPAGGSLPLLRRVGASAFLLTIALLLAGLATSAGAAQTRIQINTFGAEGGAEGSNVVDPYPLASPHGIAVDQTNEDTYVADTGNNRVEKFDSGGNFVLAFGANVGGPGVDTCESICEAGTPGSAPGQFTEAKFVAVDNSTGASAGDVYVADAATNRISKFDATGKLITSWGTGGQLNGSTTPAGSFGSVAGIAVGADGTLYVLNAASQLFEYAQEGAFVQELALARSTERFGLGANSAGSIFKVNADDSVEKLDSAGNDIGQITQNGTHPPFAVALTVDPVSGDLYVITDLAGSPATAQIRHYEFTASGQVVQAGAAACENYAHEDSNAAGCQPTDSVTIPFEGGGIGVDAATSDTFVSDPARGVIHEYGPLVTLPDATTGAASSVGPTSATLNGTVKPDSVAVTECTFEYGTEEGVYTGTIPCAQSPSEIGSGAGAVSVSASISGLVEGQTYHFRLKAGNANGASLGLDQTFVTATPPTVENISAGGLTGVSADLSAQVNPNNGATTYQFEYGTSRAYGSSVPVATAPVGEGNENVFVIQHVTGLQAGVTYHFRVTAENGAGRTVTPDHTFIFNTASGALPDGRAYEMVTPPSKNAALIGNVILGSGNVISEDGARLLMSSLQTFGGSESGTVDRQVEGEPFAFDRTPSGWTTTPLAPSAEKFEYNSDLSVSAESGDALFTMPTPPNNQDDFYARLSDGTFHDVGPVTPPEDGPLQTQGVTGSGPIAATADLSVVVFPKREGNGRWLFDDSTKSSLYEYAGTGNTRPNLVGVAGGRGSTDLLSGCGTQLGHGGGDAANAYGALSVDGSKIFFTALKCPAENGHPEMPARTLYARVDGSVSVAISTRSSGDCANPECASSPPSDAQFAGASADGSRVFFTSTQMLTNAASEDSNPSDSAATEPGSSTCPGVSGANGCNLYEYDFARPDGHRLAAVSAGDASGLGPMVQGVVAIASGSSRVYFVSKGVLTTAPDPAGEVASPGAENLYVHEAEELGHGPRTSFIAALSESDSENWNAGANHGIGLANVTPDGQYLVFPSHRALTKDVSRTNGAQQVFRFDAETNSLIRVSIGDQGFNDNGNAGAGDATIVPAAREFLRAGAARPDPTMSHDGSYVFFQSPIALTPGALDDVPIDSAGNLAQNVYEYHEGRVSLISDGRDTSSTELVSSKEIEDGSTSSVTLVGTDAAGSNVFFTTTDQLVPQDTDTQLDYYDARICTPAEPCIPPRAAPSPPCQEEGCHGTPQGGLGTLSPGSVATGGTGNLPAAALPKVPKSAVELRADKLRRSLAQCRKEKDHKKRAACEKRARTKYGPNAARKKPRATSKRSAKKASHDRRSGR